ncbi:hypothetical protein F5Y16DRAFT_398203 [Xylariaceae sp. FL0255]|nr:hypothetical protein F5Y16DRAFT_398203 [Xylariaceae sp. FL0255]
MSAEKKSTLPPVGSWGGPTIPGETHLWGHPRALVICWQSYYRELSEEEKEFNAKKGSLLKNEEVDTTTTAPTTASIIVPATATTTINTTTGPSKDSKAEDAKEPSPSPPPTPPPRFLRLKSKSNGYEMAGSKSATPEVLKPRNSGIEKKRYTGNAKSMQYRKERAHKYRKLSLGTWLNNAPEKEREIMHYLTTKGSRIRSNLLAHSRLKGAHSGLTALVMGWQTQGMPNR